MAKIKGKQIEPQNTEIGILLSIFEVLCQIRDTLAFEANQKNSGLKISYPLADDLLRKSIARTASGGIEGL